MASLESDQEPVLSETSDHDVIYALRTAHQNQTQLIILADHKANVLIGIVAVIASVLIAKVNLFSADNSLLFCIVFFLMMEFVALIYAILVVMPTNIGKISSKNIDEMPNPLYFGFFTNYSQDEFIDYLSENLKDDRSARRLLAQDFYQVGKVLKRKYQKLKYAYTFAIIGFLALFFGCIAYFYF